MVRTVRRSKKGTSMTAVAIAIIIIIIVVAGSVVYFSRSSKTTSTTLSTSVTASTNATCACLPKEIPIGLAIAVSGGYSVDGPLRLKGALLAIDEMNSLLEKEGAPFRFKPIHEDTQDNPQVAVTVVKRFISLGVQVIVGPLSTAETAAVMPVVNRAHVVVISPSSTGTAAAFPNDYVFRMPPPDSAQGPALANLIHKLGYTKLVIIARNDAYGSGLAKLVQSTFKNLGGQVKLILYDPTKPDLSEEVNTLASDVSNFGADNKTAVLVIAFDTDGRQILERSSSIGVLSKVKWFGSDSMARNTFLKVGEIASFLNKVNIVITSPALPKNNPVAEHFEQLYQQKYGIKPTPYAYYSYDAAWVAMLSVLTAGKYDGQAIKAVLPTVCFHFMGATGYKMLNQNGDAGIANYAMLSVVKTASGYSFKEVGTLSWINGHIEVKWSGK